MRMQALVRNSTVKSLHEKISAIQEVKSSSIIPFPNFSTYQNLEKIQNSGRKRMHKVLIRLCPKGPCHIREIKDSKSLRHSSSLRRPEIHYSAASADAAFLSGKLKQQRIGMDSKTHQSLQFPNAVVLNAVGRPKHAKVRKRAQMSANASLQKSAKERK